MNKQELVNSISTKANQSKKDSEVFLKAFIESVEEALANGEKVSLVGFGTWEVSERKERQVPVNPKKKELGTKTMSKHNVPVFKAGKQLKDVVNK